MQGPGNIHDMRECSAAVNDAVAAVMLSAYTVSALSYGKMLQFSFIILIQCEGRQ